MAQVEKEDVYFGSHFSPDKQSSFSFFTMTKEEKEKYLKLKQPYLFDLEELNEQENLAEEQSEIGITERQRGGKET